MRDFSVEVESRFETANRFVKSMYANLVVMRRAFSKPDGRDNVKQTNPGGNGNGDNWTWDLPHRGEEPGILRMVEALLKQEIPTYNMFMFQCVWCSMVFVNYKDRAFRSGDHLLGLPERERIIYGYIQDALNGVISPPINADNFLENGIEMSSGICKFCFGCHTGEKRRESQKQEGNPDCFGKSLDYCDQAKCCFYEDCVPGQEELKEFPVWAYRISKMIEIGKNIPFRVVERG